MTSVVYSTVALLLEKTFSSQLADVSHACRNNG